MELNDIKKHITHFSLELKDKTVQEEEVVVGGKITAIVAPIDDKYPMHIVMLDDLIGVTQVLVPVKVMEAFKDDFSIGNYIFVEGFVSFVSHHQKNGIQKDVSVFAFGVKPYLEAVGDGI